MTLTRDHIEQLPVAFLLPAEGQPRFKRRVDAVERAGHRVMVAGFVRHRFPEGISTIDPDQFLGTVVNQRFLRRLTTYIRGGIRFRAMLRKRQVVHAFGLDMAAVAILAGIGKDLRMIVEIADIHRVQTHSRGLRAVIIRQLERWVLQRANDIVATSEAYVERYIAEVRNLPDLQQKSIVIHNTPVAIDDRNVGGSDRASKPAIPALTRDVGAKRIGYFGIIRCSRSVEALLDWADTDPDAHLVMAGTFNVSRELFERLKDNQRATWLGAYKNPDDLPRLYGAVDLVWTAYGLRWDSPSNWQWARTNRFFETCSYGVPPITREGTPDGDDARRLSIGPVLSIPAKGWKEAVVSCLTSFSADDIRQWKRQVAHRGEEVLNARGQEVAYIEMLRTSKPALEFGGMSTSSV